jgi:hypothetical protein
LCVRVGGGWWNVSSINDSVGVRCVTGESEVSQEGVLEERGGIALLVFCFIDFEKNVTNVFLGGTLDEGFFVIDLDGTLDLGDAAILTLVVNLAANFGLSALFFSVQKTVPMLGIKVVHEREPRRSVYLSGSLTSYV